jgi:hypothetical protein
MFDYDTTFETSSDAIRASSNIVQNSFDGRPSVILGSLFPSWLMVNSLVVVCEIL